MSGAQLTALVVGITIGAIALVVAGVVIHRRRRATAVRVATNARKQANPAYNDYGADRNDPLKLAVGDLIEGAVFGLDKTFAVCGTLTFVEGGYTWKEHFVDTGRGAKEWLSVEKDEGNVSVIRWSTLKHSGLGPGTKTLTHNGVTYKLDEHGRAKYTSEGETDLLSQGRVSYYDYEGPDGAWIAFEKFDDGAWETNVGQEIPASSLTIYSTRN